MKVIRGSHAGETGTVTHVAQDSERWVALLFLDSGSKEISVFVNDLQLSTEVSHGEQELAGYELYDLVQIGATNIGVVVYLGRETLKVLTQNGTVQTVTPAELRGKRNVQRCVALRLASPAALHAMLMFASLTVCARRAASERSHSTVTATLSRWARL